MRASCTPRSAAPPPNHAYAICDQPGDTHTHGRPDPLHTPAEVLARVAQRERPDWAAHSVLRRTMTHPEHLDVLRERKPERDALDAYSAQLSAHVREQLHDPTPGITRRPELTRPLAPAPEPPGLGIDL